ncbi:hypothetical protein RZO55_12205 [Clostridium boliviensis]|uniref:Uncharacterized protein n=1 Tax=Clostridium boliviensis TaxID=318465 RepID=A0ABU4GMT9_9CLOT|nr:hypothetical protein [Clostridium boliviensis]MDW2798337.1 hypothetical protein [Clostridium boliviensis]
MIINKIFKKIMCCTAIVTLLTSNTGFAFAANDTNASSKPAERCTITLTGPHGTQYNVQAFEAPQLEKRSADGSISKTYSYSLENQYMHLEAATKGQSINLLGGQNNDEWDDSISVHGFITINYSTTTLSNGQKGYLLTSVSGRWTKSDNHVTMSGKRVAYTCQDANHQQQITLKYPSSNSFSYRTNYSSYVSDIATGVLGANSHIELNHAGSGTWSLDVTCNYFDNNIIDYL